MEYLRTFELFNFDKTYDYELVEVDRSQLFSSNGHSGDIYLYKFISSLDQTKYYVQILHDFTSNYSTVSFSDKKYRSPLISILKGPGKDVLTNKNEPFNILNTVIKICKDFYDEHKNQIDCFYIKAHLKKRINVYTYIIKKYFKNWKIITKQEDEDLYSMTIKKPEI